MVSLLPSPPCIPSYSTAYLFCIPSLLKALSIFRAELPSEMGTRLRRAVRTRYAPHTGSACFSPLLWIACVHNARFDDLTAGSRWVVQCVESLVDQNRRKRTARAQASGHHERCIRDERDLFLRDAG